MGGEGEAAGDVLTGAVIARTVDAATVSPTAQGGAAAAPACPNCGAARAGKFCAACGQAAHLHRSLLSLGHDILHGVFHFEGRIWRTVPELFFHPGRLTRRYIDGERAKFVSPMALFLFTVFLMFAVFSFTGGALLEDGSGLQQIGTPIVANWQAGNQSAMEATEEKLEALREQRTDDLPADERARLEREIADLEAAHAVMDALDRGDWAKLAEVKAEEEQRKRAGPIDPQAAVQQAGAPVGSQQAGVDRTDPQSSGVTRASGRAATEATEQRSGGLELPAGSAETAAEPSGGNAGLNLDLGSPALERRLNDGFKALNSNPDLLLYKLKTNGYKFSWALVPMSVPFLWLLFFWRRDVHLYDHAIFVTYSISFVMLLIVLASLAATAGVSGGIWGTALVLIPPIHLYKQLRGAYGLSRFGAYVRLFLLLICIFCVLLVFTLLLLLIGVLS